MALKKELLLLLACPKCKGTLDYLRIENALVCKKCRLKFRILDGDIPDMLIQDAEKL